MKRTYDYSLKATDSIDDYGQAGGLKHVEQDPRLADYSQAATVVNLRGTTEMFSVAQETLLSPERPVSYEKLQKQQAEYRFSGDKTFSDSTSCSDYQTYLNNQFWIAGITTRIIHDPGRVRHRDAGGHEYLIAY